MVESNKISALEFQLLSATVSLVFLSRVLVVFDVAYVSGFSSNFSQRRALSYDPTRKRQECNFPPPMKRRDKTVAFDQFANAREGVLVSGSVRVSAAEIEWQLVAHRAECSFNKRLN